MNQKRREHVYVIECVWCGTKIREDKKHDGHAVCLNCFYQMLSNHLQSQKRTACGEFVSDR